MVTAEARAARERKQKMVVVVGGIVLLLLLAFQLPRLLGGSSASSAAPAVETTASDPAATPVVPTQTRVVLVDTDRPLAPAPGQLGSFTVFTRKDPFVQQVESPTAPAGSTGTGGEQTKTKDSSKGFSVGGAPAPSVTVISVNGARQALEPGAVFPAADPVFVLVAEQADQMTVTIGIAGGAYESGANTTKLKVGKPLVLTNTTTGARYRLVLVAVGSGEESPASNASPSEPTTP